MYGAESTPFTNGTLALMVTYANRVLYINGMDDDYGLVMPPKGPDATDYISDKNWFVGYMVMKNTPNPAGTVEFASLYLKPGYASSSELQGDLMAAQAATYRLDEQSIEILSKIPAVNHATSYQIYWSLYVNGETISTLGIYKFPSFADGSLSPETYYASIEDAVNNILESIMGL